MAEKKVVEHIGAKLSRSRARPYDRGTLPRVPGIYAIFARDKNIAKQWGLTATNEDGLLYLGKAEKHTLQSRLGDHFEFNGNSTFRVGMIAVLKDKLNLGDVCPRFKTGKQRATSFGKEPRFSDYRLVSDKDEMKVTEWLQNEALVACIGVPDIDGLDETSLDQLENVLLVSLKPLLNLRGNWSGGNAVTVNALRKALTDSARGWHGRGYGSQLGKAETTRKPGTGKSGSGVAASGPERHRRSSPPPPRGLATVKANLDELRKIARRTYKKYGADPEGWSLKDYLAGIDALEEAISHAEREEPGTAQRWEAEKRARNRFAQPLYFRGRVRLATGGLGYYRSKVGNSGVEWDSTELSSAANTLVAGPLTSIYRLTAEQAGA